MKEDYLYKYLFGVKANPAKDFFLTEENNQKFLTYTDTRTHQVKRIKLLESDYKKRSFIFLGFMIQQGYHLEKIEESKFLCKKDANFYTVDLKQKTCNCKHFIWKSKNDPTFKCKHINFTNLAIKFSKSILSLY